MATKQTSKDRATAAALEWSKRVDLPAYIYKTARGWRWTIDRYKAYLVSSTIETVDAYPPQAVARAMGRVEVQR